MPLTAEGIEMLDTYYRIKFIGAGVTFAGATGWTTVETIALTSSNIVLVECDGGTVDDLLAAITYTSTMIVSYETSPVVAHALSNVNSINFGMGAYYVSRSGAVGAQYQDHKWVNVPEIPADTLSVLPMDMGIFALTADSIYLDGVQWLSTSTYVSATSVSDHDKAVVLAVNGAGMVTRLMFHGTDVTTDVLSDDTFLGPVTMHGTFCYANVTDGTLHTYDGTTWTSRPVTALGNSLYHTRGKLWTQSGTELRTLNDTTGAFEVAHTVPAGSVSSPSINGGVHVSESGKAQVVDTIERTLTGTLQYKMCGHGMTFFNSGGVGWTRPNYDGLFHVRDDARVPGRY